MRPKALLNSCVWKPQRVIAGATLKNDDVDLQPSTFSSPPPARNGNAQWETKGRPLAINSPTDKIVASGMTRIQSRERPYWSSYREQKMFQTSFFFSLPPVERFWILVFIYKYVFIFAYAFIFKFGNISSLGKFSVDFSVKSASRTALSTTISFPFRETAQHWSSYNLALWSGQQLTGGGVDADRAAKQIEIEKSSTFNNKSFYWPPNDHTPTPFEATKRRNTASKNIFHPTAI